MHGRANLDALRCRIPTFCDTDITVASASLAAALTVLGFAPPCAGRACRRPIWTGALAALLAYLCFALARTAIVPPMAMWAICGAGLGAASVVLAGAWGLSADLIDPSGKDT